MSVLCESVPVSLAPDGLLPQAFQWAGRSYRVLAVEGIKTCGPERRYRVASREGYFELALRTGNGTWYVRRRPNWISRALHRWQNGARYPLPFWRRRRARILPPARHALPAQQPPRPAPVLVHSTVR